MIPDAEPRPEKYFRKMAMNGAIKLISQENFVRRQTIMFLRGSLRFATDRWQWQCPLSDFQLGYSIKYPCLNLALSRSARRRSDPVRYLRYFCRADEAPVGIAPVSSCAAFAEANKVKPGMAIVIVAVDWGIHARSSFETVVRARLVSMKPPKGSAPVPRYTSY